MTNNSNQPKHTQGEWITERQAGGKQIIYAKTEDGGGYIAAVDNAEESKNSANAQRIVKAVNMHDELVETIKESDELFDILRDKDTNGELQKFKLTFEKIKQLLKQAELK